MCNSATVSIPLDRERKRLQTIPGTLACALERARAGLRERILQATVYSRVVCFVTFDDGKLAILYIDRPD